MAARKDEVFHIGSMQMTVRPLDARAADGLQRPFVALLPALDLTRLPATTAVVPALLRAGCVDIILAGPRAEAYHQHVDLVIEQQGATAASSPFAELGDACHAALFGALVHKSGLALCVDDAELLATLRAAATANGWTVPRTEPARPPTRERAALPRRAQPKPKSKVRTKAKVKGKTKAKARK